MAHRFGCITGIVFALALPYVLAFAQGTEQKNPNAGQPVALKADALAYGEIKVPGFPPGLKMANISSTCSASLRRTYATAAATCTRRCLLHFTYP